MKVLSGVYWSAGAEKAVNQDSLALQQIITARGRVVLALVCDGIGGLPQGEVASGYVVEQVTNWFYETGLALIAERKGRGWIKRSVLREFFRIQEELGGYGKKKGIQMGTTVSLLLLWGRRYLVFHLGDSRIYFYKRGMVQLTVDHCVKGGALTKCMGSFFWQRPDVVWGRVRRNSGVLLCTDGFRNRIRVNQLEEVLQPGEIKEERQIEVRLREIAEYSMNNGERDNLSAIYIKVI